MRRRAAAAGPAASAPRPARRRATPRPSTCSPAGLPLAEAIRRTQDRTRQLAKRQLTWLRSFKRAVWITA